MLITSRSTVARVSGRNEAFDHDLGRYLAAAGSDPGHLMVLASDHGFSDVDRHEDIALALERIGIATSRHPKLWRRNPAAAVMVSGNAAASEQSGARDRCGEAA